MKRKKLGVFGSSLLLACTLAGASLVLTACSNSDSSSSTSKQSSSSKTDESEVAEETVEPGEQILLTGAVNVRDIGGYKTEDGKTIKAKKLLRGAELANLTDEDKKILTNDYDLKTVVDFRTDTEMKTKPDPIIENVKNIADPIMKDTGTSTSQEDFNANLAKIDDPEAYLVNANKGFVNDEFSRSGYKKFFQALLDNEEGSVLWHCTAGKDRAGFGTALIMLALGVDRDTVMEDYLLTNKFREETNKAAVEAVAKSTNNNEKAIAAMTAMMDVREVYLRAAFDEMDKNYDGVDGSLKDGLGLTEDDLDQLKEMYLS